MPGSATGRRRYVRDPIRALLFSHLRRALLDCALLDMSVPCSRQKDSRACFERKKLRIQAEALAWFQSDDRRARWGLPFLFLADALDLNVEGCRRLAFKLVYSPNTREELGHTIAMTNFDLEELYPEPTLDYWGCAIGNVRRARNGRVLNFGGPERPRRRGRPRRSLPHAVRDSKTRGPALSVSNGTAGLSQ